MTPQRTKGVAFVTGASSGIGEATALHLKELGFTTYAAARRVAKMEPLQRAGIRTLSLDLEKDHSIREAVETVADENGGIDVLVNNAGYGVYGSVEEVALAEARRQMEVNFFGLAAITQLVIPRLRTQRHGRIVNISSVGGVTAAPYGAWYHASKFAVEAFSTSLRQEMAPFGVDVVTVRPGAIKSGWRDIVGESILRNSGEGPYAKAVKAMYGKFMSAEFEKLVTDPSVIARVIGEAVTARRPKAIYTAPRLARNIILINALLGTERMRDGFTRKFMGLPSEM